MTEYTRYDVKKLFNGQDDDLCWAFSASNAIKYWQDMKNSQGVAIPSGTPIGKPTASYSSDIAQIFADNWINDGGEECNAFEWWFSGKIPMPDDGGGIGDGASALKPGASGGTYWLGTPYASGTICTEVFFDGIESDYLMLAETIDRAIAMDYALACGIYSEEAGAHSITLWGYETDDITDEIVGIWICDSDNSHLGNFLVDLVWDEEDLLQSWGWPP